MSMKKIFPKTVNEALDYGWRYSRVLPPDDPIATSTWTVDPGLTVDSTSHDDDSVAVFLSGGGAVGDRYECTNLVVSEAGRKVERTFYIEIVDKRYV